MRNKSNMVVRQAPMFGTRRYYAPFTAGGDDYFGEDFDWPPTCGGGSLDSPFHGGSIACFVSPADPSCFGGEYGWCAYAQPSSAWVRFATETPTATIPQPACHPTPPATTCPLVYHNVIAGDGLHVSRIIGSWDVTAYYVWMGFDCPDGSYAAQQPNGCDGHFTADGGSFCAAIPQGFGMGCVDVPQPMQFDPKPLHVKCTIGVVDHAFDPFYLTTHGTAPTISDPSWTFEYDTVMPCGDRGYIDGGYNISGNFCIDDTEDSPIPESVHGLMMTATLQGDGFCLHVDCGISAGLVVYKDGNNGEGTSFTGVNPNDDQGLPNPTPGA